jgi:hypothetical protein
MPEYTGKDLIASWVTSTGTTTFTADYQKFSWSPSIEKFKTRASSEAAETYITGATDFTATLDALAQTSGTALTAQCALGQIGTLTVQPEGTATGKQKFTLPCMVDKYPLTDFMFNDLVHINVNWQGNGTYTATTN